MDKLPPFLILAGGLGTRLGAAFKDQPKSLVPVLGRPFIEHQLSLLKKQGVQDVVLCVGHQEKALRQFAGDGTRFGLRLRYSSDGETLLGTGGAVLKASRLSGSPFAVLYGDSYLDISIEPAFSAFTTSGKPGLMTVYHNKNTGVPSNILIEEGRVVAYDKANPAPHLEHIDFGLSFFTAAAFVNFGAGIPFDLGEVTKELIGRGDLACFEVSVPFHEVGTPEGVHELETYLQTQKQAN